MPDYLRRERRRMIREVIRIEEEPTVPLGFIYKTRPAIKHKKGKRSKWRLRDR